MHSSTNNLNNTNASSTTPTNTHRGKLKVKKN